MLPFLVCLGAACLLEEEFELTAQLLCFLPCYPDWPNVPSNCSGFQGLQNFLIKNVFFSAKLNASLPSWVLSWPLSFQMGSRGSTFLNFISSCGVFSSENATKFGKFGISRYAEKIFPQNFLLKYSIRVSSSRNFQAAVYETFKKSSLLLPREFYCTKFDENFRIIWIGWKSRKKILINFGFTSVPEMKSPFFTWRVLFHKSFLSFWCAGNLTGQKAP